MSLGGLLSSSPHIGNGGGGEGGRRGDCAALDRVSGQKAGSFVQSSGQGQGEVAPASENTAVVLIFRERHKSSEPHTARSGWRPEGR